MSDWFQKVRTEEDVNLKDIPNLLEISDDNHTYLQEAIARKPERAQDLIRLGVPLDHQDNSGQTALQYAISRDYKEIALRIIEGGANVNLTDRYGNTSLWTAVMRPRPDLDIVRAIVRAGGDPHLVNNAGRSPLEMAEKKGNNALANALNYTK